MINSFGLDFLPQKYDSKEPLKQIYDPNDLAGVVKLWLNEEHSLESAAEYGRAGGFVLMEKKRSPKVKYMITWQKGNQSIGFSSFDVYIDFKYFKDNQRTERFLDLCRQLAYVIEPVYGQIINSKYPDWDVTFMNLHVRMPDILWGTLLGKPYIKMFGREKILTTPCQRVEELGENVILLQATKNLFEPVPQEVKNTIKHHLGDDAFIGDSKDYRTYKSGWVPEFDFSAVTIEGANFKPLPKPQRWESKLVNRDDKRRMELLGISSPQYSGNRLRFENLDTTHLKMLINEGFADVEDTQNNSPSLGEIFRFMQKYPEFTAFGYAISPQRRDYRITLDGVIGQVAVGSEAYNAFIALFEGADEFEFKDGLCRAWFD